LILKNKRFHFRILVQYTIIMKLLDNITGKEACYKTNFHFHNGKKTLNFKFICYSSKLFSYSNKYNDELYHGDVCEVFINYGKDNHYYEIEVAPNGTIFLADIENNGTNFKGTLIEQCFIKAFSVIKRNKYIVTINVPRDYIKTDKVAFNAFRIDTDGGIENAHLFAFHPTMCNTFHKKEKIY